MPPQQHDQQATLPILFFVFFLLYFFVFFVFWDTPTPAHTHEEEEEEEEEEIYRVHRNVDWRRIAPRISA
jgi:phosphotransferase system  glucose/maltose/N-acetylglucosamine-specific IIC component